MVQGLNVPSAGIEPTLSAPQAGVLSVERRGPNANGVIKNTLIDVSIFIAFVKA